MKYISNRKDFLRNRKNNIVQPLNEEATRFEMGGRGPMGNDINWGDSLVGRLFNSVLRVVSARVKTKQLDGLQTELRKALDSIIDLAEFNSLDVENKQKAINSSAKKVYDTFLDELENADFDEILKNGVQSIRFDYIDLYNFKYINEMSVILGTGAEMFKKINNAVNTYGVVIDGAQSEVKKLNSVPTNKKMIKTSNDTNLVKIKTREELIKYVKDKTNDEAGKIISEYMKFDVNNESEEDIDKYLYLTLVYYHGIIKVYKETNFTNFKNNISKMNKIFGTSYANILSNLEKYNLKSYKDKFKLSDIDVLKLIEYIRLYDKDNNLKRVYMKIEKEYLLNSNLPSVMELKKYSNFINENTPAIRANSNVIPKKSNLPSKLPIIDAQNDSDHIEDIEFEDIDDDDVNDDVKKGVSNKTTIEFNSKSMGTFTINLSNPDDIKDKLKDIWKKAWEKDFPDIENMKIDEIKPIDNDRVINKNQLMQILMRIVNIFDRAQDKYSVDVIPGGRSGGRVSSKTFSKYKALGKGATPENAGAQGGPFLYKPAFKKWSRFIQNILGEPKYQNIYSNKIIMTIGEESDGTPVKKVKFGDNLVKYMNQMLNGEDLYDQNAQYNFINKLFGIKIDVKNDDKRSTPDDNTNTEIGQFSIGVEENNSYNTLLKLESNYLQMTSLYENKKGDKTYVLSSIVGRDKDGVSILLITNLNYLKKVLSKNMNEIDVSNITSNDIPDTLDEVRNRKNGLKYDFYIMKISSSKSPNDLSELKLYFIDEKNILKETTIESNLVGYTHYLLKNDKRFKFDYGKIVNLSVFSKIKWKLSK